MPFVDTYFNIANEVLVADGENARVLKLSAGGEINGILSEDAKDKAGKILAFVSSVSFNEGHIAVGYDLNPAETLIEWYNPQNISPVHEVKQIL